MVAQCSICLSSKFKEPVCTPCGHVYCKSCLIEHVNVPTNQGMTSKCPECRAEFHLFTPDLAYLPEKYHPFIQPAVRRIYAEMSPDAALQKKLNQVEKSLWMKSKTEELLLVKCENLRTALEAHQKGERDAVTELEELQERFDEVECESEEAIVKLNGRCYELEEENVTLKKENQTWHAKVDALQKKLEKAELRQRTLEKELEREMSYDWFPLAPLQKPLISEAQLARGDRLMKPLPRRRLLRTRDEDNSVNSLATAKRARISDV